MRSRAVAAVAVAVVGLAACNSLWGVDDLQFGGSPGTSTGGSGGLGGSTGSAGFGGSGGNGGTAGGGGVVGGGGTGGHGGQPPVLTDRGLVVRYYLDEAASGQAPTEIHDGAVNPLDLTLSYAPELSFIEIAGNRGLQWTEASAEGRATVAVAGTKLLDTIHDSTMATAELVVAVENSVYFDRFLSVHLSNQPGDHFGLALPFGATSISFHPYAWTGDNAGEWTVALTTLGRVVIHVVIDTTLSAEADRTRLFVDGSAAAATTAPSTTFVPLQAGATIDLGTNTIFTVGNKPGTSRSIQGTIFYVALYAAALTGAEIDNNGKVLIANDDHP